VFLPRRKKDLKDTCLLMLWEAALQICFIGTKYYSYWLCLLLSSPTPRFCRLVNFFCGKKAKLLCNYDFYILLFMEIYPRKIPEE
jgi:hypothetical protein